MALSASLDNKLSSRERRFRTFGANLHVPSFSSDNLPPKSLTDPHVPIAIACYFWILSRLSTFSITELVTIKSERVAYLPIAKPWSINRDLTPTHSCMGFLILSPPPFFTSPCCQQLSANQDI